MAAGEIAEAAPGRKRSASEVVAENMDAADVKIVMDWAKSMNIVVNEEEARKALKDCEGNVARAK